LVNWILAIRRAAGEKGSSRTGGSAIAYEIRRNGDALEGQQTGRKSEELRAEAPDVLFVPGRPRYRYVFLRDAGGKITGLAQRREAWDLVWKRTLPPGTR
jgi:hypothetical protein